eukprot:Amastigsp_a339696_2656.p2 type:complete len:199 gc:universal Amastigsp_a339696_2656:626-30(-)
MAAANINIEVHVLVDQLKQAMEGCAAAPPRDPLDFLALVWTQLTARYAGRLPASFPQCVNVSLKVPEDKSSLTPEARVLLNWQLKSEIDRISLSMLVLAENKMKDADAAKKEALKLEKATLLASYLLANYKVGIPLDPTSAQGFWMSDSNLLTAQKIFELINRARVMDEAFTPLLDLCTRCAMRHQKEDLPGPIDPWA